MTYQPPFTITPVIVQLVSSISEHIGKIDTKKINNSPELRKQNRIKTITGTLAIEGNTLNEEQITAVLEGKHIIGSPKEIAEVHGAIRAYEALSGLNPINMNNLLKAHGLMMGDILIEAGQFRKKSVGIHKGEQLVHMAPQAHRVPLLMADLFQWMKNSEHHPLIVSSIFHYEFEFIHPFSDGNGRMGRFWQTLILGKWKPLFFLLPLESVINDRQHAYYEALAKSDKRADSTIFIEFMLSAINEILQYNIQVTDQVTDQVKKLLSIMGNDWLSASEMMEKTGLSHKPTFRKNYLNPAIKQKLIRMSEPGKPRSPKQKYKQV